MAGRVVNFFRGAIGSKPTKEHYSFKMLVIGETGSGKTSFLNLLCNCGMIQALGLNFDANGIAQFRQFNEMKLENAQSCQMESKTDGAKLYNVELGDLRVGVIDTPGFGDSRGMKVDEENVKKIIATLQGEDYVNCVCLIINGRNARTSVVLKYVLSEITAILPREILNNILVVFSNTADMLDLNFDPNELEKYFGQKIENFFCIENPYCRFEKAKQKQKQLPIEKIAKSLQKSFVDTAEVLHEMYVTMKDFKQVHTLRFITLFEKKQEVESKVFQMLTSYDYQKKKEADLESVKKQVDAALETKNLTKDFKIVTYEKRTVLEKSKNGHNTLCGYAGCHSNCHVPCSLPKSLNKEAFKQCATIESNGYCNEPGCGHHYTYHYHEESWFKEISEPVTSFSTDMKEQFDNASTQEERGRLVHAQLEAQIEASKAKRERLSKQLREVMEEFHALGISRNYAMLIDSQLQVIKSHIKGERSGSADLQKTKEDLEKKLKVVNDALRNKVR